VFTIADPGELNSGAYANNVVNGGTFNYSSTAAQTISGVISGAGAFNINGGGTLVLTGANTFTGAPNISGGSIVSLNADSGLGGSAVGVTLNGGCIKNNNSSPTLGSGRTITLGASGGYFDAGWAPSHPLTISSKLTGSGKLLIDMDGSPVVLANTANNYSGDTIIGTNGPGYYVGGTQAWLKLGASSVLRHDQWLKWRRHRGQHDRQRFIDGGREQCHQHV
jgi:fibronectin-binding autotransporter adhesin